MMPVRVPSDWSDGMIPEVQTSGGMVVVEVETPQRCAIALHAGEAIDLARLLVAAAVDVTPAAETRPRPVKPW